MRPLAVVLVVVTIVVAFSSIHVSASSPLQSSPQSAAWIAAYAFPFAGGFNQIEYGAINLGTHPVTICLNDWAANGTEITTAYCTPNPVSPHGVNWWYTNQGGNTGWSGSIMLYSKDGTTPIVPFGYMEIDQQGNKVINAATPLTWMPTSAP